MVPPSFDDLVAWAGEGRVVRADPAAIAGWLLPEPQKAALVATGIPMIGQDIINAVRFTELTPAGGRAAYQLALNVDDQYEWRTTMFSVESDTGWVWETVSDRRRLVNSSIIDWQWSLHLVGVWLATSSVIDRWDEDGEAEEAALCELADLRDRIRDLDPNSYGEVGHHDTHYWPAVLDRWLY